MEFLSKSIQIGLLYIYKNIYIKGEEMDDLKIDKVHNKMYTDSSYQKSCLKVVFFKSKNGNLPCREFLVSLSKEDRCEVGACIFAVQKGFPMGLPLCKKISADLWEIRIIISAGKCRIFFTIFEGTIILLHGFIKKTQKIPLKEKTIANNRLKEFEELNK